MDTLQLMFTGWTWVEWTVLAVFGAAITAAIWPMGRSPKGRRKHDPDGS